MSLNDLLQALLGRTRPDPIGGPYARPVADPADLAPSTFGRVFAVYVTKDGGVAGDGMSEACSWTYSVYRADNARLLKKNVAGDAATAMSPQRARLANAIYSVYAGAGTTHLGLAMRDEAGTLILLDVLGEVPDTENCET